MSNLIFSATLNRNTGEAQIGEDDTNFYFEYVPLKCRWVFIETGEELSQEELTDWLWPKESSLLQDLEFQVYYQDEWQTTDADDWDLHLATPEEFDATVAERQEQVDAKYAVNEVRDKAPELLSILRRLGAAIEEGDPDTIANLWVGEGKRLCAELPVLQEDDLVEEE
jgi:hypothetical protein